MSSEEVGGDAPCGWCGEYDVDAGGSCTCNRCYFCGDLQRGDCSCWEATEAREERERNYG